MTQTIDNIIAARMLYLLVQPFDKTDAFQLGIIDEKGKILKKMSELKTQDEKDAFDYLHRIVYKIKRLIGKLPGGNSQLASLATAYALVKEEAIGGGITTTGVAAGLSGDPVMSKKKKVHPLFRRYVKSLNK